MSYTQYSNLPVICCDSAAVGVSGQWQGGGSDGFDLWHGPLWKNQEGLCLIWGRLHPQSHLGTQRSRRDTAHQSTIWRCVDVSTSSLTVFIIVINQVTIPIFIYLLGDGVPTVFVAVAGRSNGLGPVMSGNTAYPVINCPPISPDWGAQDVWSSLRLPSGTFLFLFCFFYLCPLHSGRWCWSVAHSFGKLTTESSGLSLGLGCSTILSPEASAQFAAQIFGLTNHLVWCKLRASLLNTWVSLKLADKKLQACTIWYGSFTLAFLHMP